MDRDGNKVGPLLSEDITLQVASVPEPSSALLGAALFGGLLLLHKMQKSLA